MRSLITSYLLQSKECVLPGIGTLQIHNIPAKVDSVNKQILPPTEEILFKEESNSASHGLIKYIADKKEIELKKAEHLVTNFCNEWKEKINAGEKLNLETVGSIQKNSAGIINFTRESSNEFYKQIPVEEFYQNSLNTKEEKVAKEEIQPETNLILQNNFDDRVAKKSYWGWWAALLAAVAFGMIFYKLKEEKFQSSSIGNQHNLVIDSASATYKVSK